MHTVVTYLLISLCIDFQDFNSKFTGFFSCKIGFVPIVAQYTQTDRQTQLITLPRFAHVHGVIILGQSSCMVHEQWVWLGVIVQFFLCAYISAFCYRNLLPSVTGYVLYYFATACTEFSVMNIIWLVSDQSSILHDMTCLDIMFMPHTGKAFFRK